MKDFDSERDKRLDVDRAFRIGGETFTYRPAVSPEALLPYNRAITGEYTPTEEEWIKLYDDTIVALLEPGLQETWLHVRNADAKNPLTVADLNELLQWLLEAQTGRPTGQPSDSSTSSGGNGTPSKDVPSSTEAPSKVSAPDRP